MIETLKAIDEYEARNTLNDEQRRELFERRLQTFLRIREWREENEHLGLEPTISTIGPLSSVKCSYKIGLTTLILANQLMVKNVHMMK